jgi:hypothetical protein
VEKEKKERISDESGWSWHRRGNSFEKDAPQLDKTRLPKGFTVELIL